ncbi:hypothetical protein ACGF3G_09345 [Streptomyces sp. NPDC048179]|uniref:hypothetical protein n=1 Tax=Streptomyces sp. NPDC048179 TaxID=3365506 RepID=UPI003722B355
MAPRGGHPAPGGRRSDTWLYEQAAGAPVGGVIIRMDVGSDAGTMVRRLRALHTLMDGLTEVTGRPV